MNSLRALKQGLIDISQLWDAEKYDDALAKVEKLLETWPGNSDLHLLNASLMQLQENPKHSLDEAKQELKWAIDLHKGSPRASIELGHFLDNVEDDPEAAAKAYAEGVATARHIQLDGLIGQAKSYRQMDKMEEFYRCLREILYLVYFDTIPNRNNAEVLGADITIRLLADHLNGPYAEQVQELLNDGRGVEPNGASEQSRGLVKRKAN